MKRERGRERVEKKTREGSEKFSRQLTAVISIKNLPTWWQQPILPLPRWRINDVNEL